MHAFSAERRAAASSLLSAGPAVLQDRRYVHNTSTDTQTTERAMSGAMGRMLAMHAMRPRGVAYAQYR